MCTLHCAFSFSWCGSHTLPPCSVSMRMPAVRSVVPPPHSLEHGVHRVAGALAVEVAEHALRRRALRVVAPCRGLDRAAARLLAAAALLGARAPVGPLAARAVARNLVARGRAGHAAGVLVRPATPRVSSFAGHFSRWFWPPLVMLPEAHIAQVLLPSNFCTCPGGHEMQLLPVFVLVLDMHDMQLDAPSMLMNVPPAQCSQRPSVVAPVALLKRSLAHCVHMEEPVVAA